MYDQQYVKKRKRRKIAALVAVFSSIGLTFFIVTSFLGRTLGTFTVSLNNSEVSLALCETKDSTTNSTFLRVNANAKYIEYSYEFFKDRLDVLDDEETPYDVGEYEYNFRDKNGQLQTGKGLDFFKYTFYVKNIGSKTAAYDLKINIDDRTRAKDDSGRSLDDTLRVLVFENDADSNEHNYRIFAKKAAENNYDINGKSTDREFIATFDERTNHETENYRLVDKNFDGLTVAEYNVNNFIKNDMKRYTIVFWLEGADPQSKPEEEYPEGATLKLGVDISAYENS
jgi:hypothetical protein